MFFDKSPRRSPGGPGRRRTRLLGAIMRDEEGRHTPAKVSGGGADENSSCVRQAEAPTGPKVYIYDIPATFATWPTAALSMLTDHGCDAVK